MLHRKDSEGLILITQPAHAWVSGQLARHWGNDTFPAPCEEVCLAAEQHDIGFLDWERFPTLDPDTGLPHTFLNLPTAKHLELWTTGIQEMLRYGRYPALLVSMHFTPLARRMQSEHDGEERRLISEWLEKQEALQRTLKTSLANDFYYGAFATDERIEHDRDLVSLVDWLSLQVCLDCQEESLLNQMPSGSPPGAITVTCCHKEKNTAEVKPWPFRTDAVRVICEGRRLLTKHTEQDQLREAIRAAAPLTVRMKLVPAE